MINKVGKKKQNSKCKTKSGKIVGLNVILENLNRRSNYGWHDISSKDVSSLNREIF